MGRLPVAVLWDMDGTLVDTEKLWGIGLVDLVRRLGGELTAATREAMIGSNMDSTMHLLFTELGMPLDGGAMADAAAWLTRRTEELFRRGVPWRPGAQQALRAVRKAGVPTALVTSTARRLTEVALDTIGREYFDVTVCGDEVAHNKPHPFPYLRAADLLAVDPADCVAIEDSPTGVASASTAGCLVLGVPCEVPLTTGERRVVRDSLVGLDFAALTALCDEEHTA